MHFNSKSFFDDKCLNEEDKEQENEIKEEKKK